MSILLIDNSQAFWFWLSKTSKIEIYTFVSHVETDTYRRIKYLNNDNILKY